MLRNVAHLESTIIAYHRNLEKTDDGVGGAYLEGCFFIY